MSLLVLLVGVVIAPMDGSYRHNDKAAYLREGIAFSLALFLCLRAWLNLIRDVERGYPPWRCSLAAILLVGPSIGSLFVPVSAVRHLLFR
jgi:hypothetical protein